MELTFENFYLYHDPDSYPVYQRAISEGVFFLKKKKYILKSQYVEALDMV